MATTDTDHTHLAGNSMGDGSETNQSENPEQPPALNKCRKTVSRMVHDLMELMVDGLAPWVRK